MASVLSVLCLITIIILVEVKYSSSCGGYKLHVDYIRNCGKNNSIELSNDFRPVLHDDCTVTMIGCTVIKKPFKTAYISYDVTRNGMNYYGTKNACYMMDQANDEVRSIMEIMGVPKHCPVTEGTICGHGKEIDIRRHRLKLTMVAGNAKGRAELKTNSGTSCFEFSARLNRKFFSG